LTTVQAKATGLLRLDNKRTDNSDRCSSSAVRVVYRGSALCRCPCDHMTSRHSESLVFASQSLAVDWSGVVWPAAGGIAACAVVCVLYVGCLHSTCVRRAVVFSTGANMPARTKGESFATPHSLSLYLASRCSDDVRSATAMPWTRPAVGMNARRKLSVTSG